MKYFSTFSGIGGFELGIYDAYIQMMIGKTLYDVSRMDVAECVGYSEVDKYAIKTYQKHFNHKNYEDITKIDERTLPDFDLLVGGFPCQSFSVAGKRGGFDDTRGTLFFDLARIVREKQPRNFIFENVKGLLSHDQGDTFRTIISTLDELGYDIEWQVLNSKDFGVPQNRERVYIVGHLRGKSRPKVFPIFGENGGAIEVLNKVKHSTNRVHAVEGISPCLRTGTGGGHEPFILQTARGKNKGGIKEIAPTITKNSWEHNNHVLSGGKVRKLTPVECERLQGFPDNWTEGVSDSQRYKQCGNAVTVNVVKEIISRLYKHD